MSFEDVRLDPKAKRGDMVYEINGKEVLRVPIVYVEVSNE